MMYINRYLNIQHSDFPEACRNHRLLLRSPAAEQAELGLLCFSCALTILCELSKLESSSKAVESETHCMPAETWMQTYLSSRSRIFSLKGATACNLKKGNSNGCKKGDGQELK